VTQYNQLSAGQAPNRLTLAKGEWRLIAVASIAPLKTLNVVNIESRGICEAK
jgi:hypothetical protein